MQDGCIKQYLIWKALAFRRENHALFEKGMYLPLAVEGSQSAHIVAFARQYRRRTVVVVVPRLCARLQGVDRGFPFEPGVWKDTKVILPEDSNSMTLTNVFTAEVVQSDSSNSLSVAALLANFPVTLLALPHAR